MPNKSETDTAPVRRDTPAGSCRNRRGQTYRSELPTASRPPSFKSSPAHKTIVAQCFRIGLLCFWCAGEESFPRLKICRRKFWSGHRLAPIRNEWILLRRSSPHESSPGAFFSHYPSKNRLSAILCFWVRGRGLEPPCLAALAPKASVSAISPPARNLHHTAPSQSRTGLIDKTHI